VAHHALAIRLDRLDCLDYLGHAFSAKPLLIGGKAMEFHGLRPADDCTALAARYPEHLKNLAGDLGVRIDVSGTEFE
jgi:hypothetical protein